MALLRNVAPMVNVRMVAAVNQNVPPTKTVKEMKCATQISMNVLKNVQRMKIVPLVTTAMKVFVMKDVQRMKIVPVMKFVTLKIMNVLRNV